MVNPFSGLFHRRRRRRDFSGSSATANPMFRPSAQQPRSLVGPFIVLLIMLGGAAWAMSSPKLRITEIQISGASKLDPASLRSFAESQLDATTLGVAWRRVIFLVPTKALAASIKASAEKLVSLERVSVRRQGWNTIVIAVSERTPHLTWETGDGSHFFLDDRGAIAEAAPAQTPNEIPRIVDSNDLLVAIGDQVLPEPSIKAIQALQAQLVSLDLIPDHFETWPIECPGIPAATPSSNANRNSSNTNQSLIVNQSPDLELSPCNHDDAARAEPTIVVAVSEGWEIRFTSASPIDIQIEKLTTALRERIGSKRSNLKYIDVRFGDRVYFQ